MSSVAAPPAFLRYRSLIWNFAQRDLKARFKGTAIGWIWSLLLPLASLLTYTIVAKVILRAKADPFGNGRPGNYVVFLFVALTVWLFWANGINTAIGSLIGNGPLLKKIYFPSYTPVIGATIAIAIQSGIEICIIMIIMLFFHNVGLTWLMIPLISAIFFIFVCSFSVVAAIATVYFRDLQYIIAVLLQLLFYGTPIIYPISRVNASHKTFLGVPLHTYILANPIAQFVERYRDVIYRLQWGPPLDWGYILLWTAFGVLLAFGAYKRYGRDLAEEL